MQTSLHEDLDGSWMPESDLAIVDLNKQQRQIQKMEMSVKRRTETSPQGWRVGGGLMKINPRKNKMKMLMALNSSDTRGGSKKRGKQRQTRAGDFFPLNPNMLSHSNIAIDD